MKRYSTLRTARDNEGVLHVNLNRPDVRNAFNDQMILDLDQIFSEYRSDDRLRAVVLRGEGSVFCAGGDLNWMKKAVDFDFDENLKDTRALARMFANLNEFPKPVIGLVQGAAIGGGVGLVSVCDIVAATEDAQFSLSEVRLGIVPACIGPFVISKIGVSQARRLFLSAERILAPQAKEIGLIHEVVSTPSELDVFLEKCLKNILQCGPNALSVAKSLVLDLSWAERRNRIPDGLEYVARILAELRISDEGQEGVRAFLEKRKPKWLKT